MGKNRPALRIRKSSIRQKIQQFWEKTTQSDYRIFLNFLMWPLLAVFTIGITTYSILLPAYKGEWLILFTLLLSGVFFSIPAAATVGSLTFITYSLWLFSTQLDGNLTASHFILLAFMPFAPIFLSATRLKIVDIMHLATLLELPQVRASMHISPWSLLPSHRALELRLKQHIKECEDNETPAVLVKFSFFELEKLVDLLGENILLHEIKEIADELRAKLRAGDMIAEDITDHSTLYVIAFPNKESDYLTGITNRLYPVLENREFKSMMNIAAVPHDGTTLFNVKWSLVEDGEIVK